MLAVTLVVLVLISMYAAHYVAMRWRYGSSNRHVAHRNFTYARRREAVVQCLRGRVGRVYSSSPPPDDEVLSMLADADIEFVHIAPTSDDVGTSRFIARDALDVDDDVWTPTPRPLSLRLLEVLCDV